MRVPSGQEGDEQRKGCRSSSMAPNNQECAYKPGEYSAEKPKGAMWPRPVIGTLSGLNRRQGTENSQESADHPGRLRAAGRANIWRERPNSEDGVEWVAGRPVTMRDPSNRKSAEQLVRRAPHGQKYAK